MTMPQVNIIDEQAAIDLYCAVILKAHKDVRSKSTKPEHKQSALELLADWQGVDLDRVAWRNTSDIGKSRRGN